MNENALMLSLAFWTIAIVIFWTYGIFKGVAFVAVAVFIFWLASKIKK
jgi:hypothetical protein